MYQRITKLFSNIVRTEDLSESDYRTERFYRHINKKTDKALSDIAVAVELAKQKLGIGEFTPTPEYNRQQQLGLLALQQSAQRQQSLSNFLGNPHVNGQAAQQIPRQYLGMLGIGSHI